MIKSCKTMDYFICDNALKCCKEAEKAKIVFNDLREVNTHLIDRMNLAFGADVFKLNVRLDKKYVKIVCRIQKCPFSIWLKYSKT